MTMRPKLIMLVLGIALCGSGLAGALYLSRQFHEAEIDHQNSALIKWGNPPTPNAELLTTVKPYDLVAFSWGVWDTPAMKQSMSDMRKQNLDVHLGTYFPMFTAPQWCKKDAERGGTGWGARWWNAMSPYLAHTTEGDTAAIFTNQYVYNVLNPLARKAAVAELKAYRDSTGITWAMLDFCSVPLPNLKASQGQQWEEMEHGDMDLDGNGVGHWEDFEEQRALNAAWHEYIKELRVALGPDFLLIPNGTLAMYSTDFSKLVDGCYVEGFSKWFYGGGETMRFDVAMDPAVGPHSLPSLCAPNRWARNPGLVMIEDWCNMGKYGYVSMLFDGAVELRRATNDVSYPPAPIDLHWLGAPTGVAQRDSLSMWSRQYENGTVFVTPNTSNIVVKSTKK